MSSWLILLVAFTASEAAKNCVNDTDWVQCTCMDDLQNTLFITQHILSQDKKWTNEVTIADSTCNMSSTLQSFKEIYVNSPSAEDLMIRKGYERLGKSLYKFHSISRTWENARRTCEEEGAHLAIINSQYEAGILQELFRRHPQIHNVRYNDFVYLGFHDLYNEGEYLTIFGEPIDKTGYSQWWGGKPDNAGWNNNGDPGEDCGSMHRDGGLNDLPCDFSHAFICELEYKPTTLPGGIDYSAGEYKGVEKVIKPPPGNKPRTDPGEGYEFFPGIGFYRLHTVVDVWENARRKCEKEGAHLAIVNSESEAQVLIQMFKQRRVIESAAMSETAFVGFHDQFNEGVHLTIYGEPLTSTGYYRWSHPSEPNDRDRSNINSGQDCGGFFKDGGYDDAFCNKKCAFFCEKELLQ